VDNFLTYPHLFPQVAGCRIQLFGWSIGPMGFVS
jgi:hypothetical protein